MDLKQRLQALRQQSGCVSAATTDAAGQCPDLRTRLGRMQHVRDAAAMIQHPDDAVVASRLGATVLGPGVLLCERHVAWPHPGLGDLPNVLRGLPEAAALQVDDWWCVDTETSGLAGGTGTLAFMLGLARIAEDGLHLRQYLLTRFAGEQQMLEHALATLGRTAGLLSYNGKTFDLPLLKTRTRLRGIRPDGWELPHLDLLYAVRRAFDMAWPDCRLLSAEHRLLGVTRVDDLPGSEAPAAWQAFVRGGDTQRLAGVLAHNAQDLCSLAGLLPAMSQVHADPVGYAANGVRIARAWLRTGAHAKAHALLEGIGVGLDGEGALLLARLRYRHGDRVGGRALLERLAGSGHREATEMLAKHHEHITRDYVRASAYAQKLPESPQRTRRLARLYDKRGPNAELPFG